ncbi:Pre-mRNA-splicing factor srp1 [Sphaceloma murrayae]|uniref:Pre-mRNA-splicing factor srp1 n=1 Tax=Sphaceloma murrayae TaxID=2082308 RepID=A0A2K1R0B7_9PEZI|nr:Pre-mRNA-splicing factor srp1 [Sphaceloma murrayae]
MSSSRSGGTTLYVTGFGHGTRARDLAYEFERYGRLVRCDIPAPRTASSRLFAFVEYENRRDADDAYYEMHNFRFSRDETLKVEWARTPPSASWRFDAGASRPAGGRRSPRRRSASPPRRGSARGDYSPRKEDRRERDYDRRDRDRDRSRSPEDRDREMKDVRDRDDDREKDRDPEPTTNGDERKDADDLPPPQAHDELDTAE